MTTRELISIAELTEAELMFQFAELAPDATRAALGITATHLGGGVVLSVRDDPMGGFWNKSLGFGLTEPVTAELIGEVIDFHREHGSPNARIQIAPELLPPDWDSIVAAHGLTLGNTVVKLVGAIDDFRPGTTDLRVGPVTEQDADKWGALLWELFGVPNGHLAATVAAGVRSGVFQGFAAWDGDEMVGVANLFGHGAAGQLNSGATRGSHRGRGVQSALIAARARAAAEAGRRWLVTETDLPKRPGGNPSLNNVIRSGLSQVYERTEWVWRPEVDSAV
ncbi:hypothetical protein [Micromonospora sp. NPDC005367]|uniref:hypothetical protein n=1 Tax=Micromonospora sp. NPDC005367 TaxID=3155590 RepID=UPI0033B606FF